MTSLQKAIKYAAMAFAIFLIVSIVGGILSAVSVASFFVDGDEVLDDMKSYSVNGNVTELTIDVGAAELVIRSGAAFDVQSNHPDLKVTVNGGRLSVTEKERLWRSVTGVQVVLTVPETTIFTTADITTGAGNVTVDALSASTLRLELGAGEVSIGSLTVLTGADVDGGAGKLTVGGGVLRDLDLDMGVGKVELTAALQGECELDQGIGAARITLLGTKEDYRIELEKGVGKATVDGTEMPNGGVYGSGINEVDISGGVGEITVAFEA